METDSRCQQLSTTQKRCLRLWHQGLSGPKIARQLEVSKSTVESHLAAARRVLGVTTSAQAAAILDRYEGQAPQNPSTYPARVDPDRAPPPSSPQPIDQMPLRMPLPLRLKGATSNDLTVRERLLWIVLLAIGIAVGLGAVASTLQFVNSLAHR